jgi:hypothetical protein
MPSHHSAIHPIVYFCSAIFLLVPPLVLTDGWPRWLLMSVFVFPACLAFWLGVEGLKPPQDAGEGD